MRSIAVLILLRMLTLTSEAAIQVTLSPFGSEDSSIAGARTNPWCGSSEIRCHFR